MSDFLYTGITSAFFKLFGKVPSSKALFIMIEITGAICKEPCLSNLAGIWSHPVAFFGFSVFRISEYQCVCVYPGYQYQDIYFLMIYQDVYFYNDICLSTML